MKQLAWPLAVVALVQAAGARSQSAPVPAADAPRVVRDIVVEAQRPKTQTLLDRKVYTVSGDLQATTGSAADILNQVPSVNVDADGGVSLRGDANVTILIDGKPSAQFSGAAAGLSLLQFPASDIDRIEVLTSPPATFKAQGSGGVINIITKKHRKPGLSGTARASVGDHGRYILGLDGAYNTGKLKLSGGVGLRQDIRERRTTTDRLETGAAANPPVPPVQSQESIDEHFRRLTPSVTGAVDYEFNSHQSAGGSFSWRQLTGHRFFDQEDITGPPGVPPTGISDRHSDGHELHLEAGGDAHFVQKLRRPDETLTVTLARSITRERERYDYTNTFPLPPADPKFSDLHLGLDLRKSEFSADYDLPMAKDRELKLGYDLEADDNSFDNSGDNIDPITRQPSIDPAVTNDFRYRQQVNALYGEYQAPVGPWRLQAGLRLEAAHASWLLITGNVPGGRSDLGLYPSLHLDRQLGASGKLTASVSRRITRPDPEALNPFSDHQDTRNLRAGNPNLAPQDTWSYEVGYHFTDGALSYGATAYYRLDRDSVTDIVVPQGADVVLSTKTNLPKSQSAGLDFDASGKLGKLSYSLAGNLFYTQIDATALGALGLKSTTGLDLKASLEYRPTGADTLQISFSRADKRLTPQGQVNAINLVNLGYRRELRPDLALAATVSDLFDGQRFRRQIDTTALVDDYTRHQIGRLVSVGLIYTFGGPAKGKSNGLEYEQ
jgi:outer membrane receptor protein involved in Fe transport